MNTAPVEAVELLLTAEIYNRTANLTETDLPSGMARHYADPETSGAVLRPVSMSMEALRKILGNAGPDGLDVVRRLLVAAPDHLTENGLLLVEVGHNADRS